MRLKLLLATVAVLMANPVLAADADKARMDALEGEIEAAMLRWEELESRAAG